MVIDTSSHEIDVIPTDDQASVFDILRSLQGNDPEAYRAIVRPTNPAHGIGGFVFDIPEESRIDCRSQITPHFVEDNTTLIDQIGLEPERFTAKGMVAEVVVRDLLPSKAKPVVRQAIPINPRLLAFPRPTLAQKLAKAASLARVLYPGASQPMAIATSLGMQPNAVSALLSADTQSLMTRLGVPEETGRAFSLARMVVAANKSAAKIPQVNPNRVQKPIPPLLPIVAPALQPDPNSVYGMFLDKAAQPPNQTRQARAFAYFYQLWKARTTIVIETPWGAMTNMAIEHLQATQPEDSRFWSSFSLTFVKVRVARSSATTVGQLAGRANAQGATQSNNGSTAQKPLSPPEIKSFAYRLMHGP